MYAVMVGKPSDLMHWKVLLKDQPKWKINCHQSTEASYKQLRINEVGAYSMSGTHNTLGTLATPLVKKHQLKKLVGLFTALEEKLTRERQRKKYRT